MNWQLFTVLQGGCGAGGNGYGYGCRCDFVLLKKNVKYKLLQIRVIQGI